MRINPKERNGLLLLGETYFSEIPKQLELIETRLPLMAAKYSHFPIDISAIIKDGGAGLL